MPFINILLSVLPLLGATVMTNLLLSALILSRLLGHERWMKKTLGVHEKSSASPLRRIITICVESCGLIIACGLFVLAVIWHDSTLNLLAVPLTFLPHICVSIYYWNQWGFANRSQFLAGHLTVPNYHSRSQWAGPVFNERTYVDNRRWRNEWIPTPASSVRASQTAFNHVDGIICTFRWLFD
jgi:hypothetical protein